LYRIGYIQKPHGLKGEVILVFEKEFEESLKSLNLLLIEVDGGLVPFFIEDDGLDSKPTKVLFANLSLLIRLHKAKELVGCKVYV
jgi:16S rRNA processing protein RimM